MNRCLKTILICFLICGLLLTGTTITLADSPIEENERSERCMEEEALLCESDFIRPNHPLLSIIIVLNLKYTNPNLPSFHRPPKAIV